jgi:RNA-binding protein
MQHFTRSRRELSRKNKTKKRASCCDDLPELRMPKANNPRKEEGETRRLSKITTRMKRHVRHVLKDEKPTLWVGKDGLTPQVSSEIENQLSKTRMVKIRILPSALQTDPAQKIASKAAEQTNASLVEVRGHVFILYRRHKKPPPESH